MHDVTVDSSSRIALRELMVKFETGYLNNQQFTDQLVFVSSNDPAVRFIRSRCEREFENLTKKYSFGDFEVSMFSWNCWKLFLTTDMPFDWPEKDLHPLIPIGLAFLLHFFSFGCLFKKVFEEDLGDDYQDEYWPFKNEQQFFEVQKGNSE